MVRDGLLYGFGLIAVAVLVWVMTHSSVLPVLPVLLAAFFMWFFRDPNRKIPDGAGLVVSPADGKVEEAEWIETRHGARIRISIFLNVFDVHVNRCPVGGTVTSVDYREGQFMNAMDVESSIHNEQTQITIKSGDVEVSFKQIAGLLARRIVCNVKPGDVVKRGERMGLIKFGSRTDILLPADATLKVTKGQRVKGGSSVLAVLPAVVKELMAEQAQGRQPAKRGMYILPSLFTAANIALGFYAVLQAIQGSAMQQPEAFDRAAIAIAVSIITDGLDGRIARLTNTSSAFGRELDSLADMITFGVAPSLLAYLWGVKQIVPTEFPLVGARLMHVGIVVCFLFLICGACRLARFNVSDNPMPKNPGRPGRKYFVGMPIPAGAGVLAAVVHFESGSPIHSMWWSMVWLALIACTGFLMVSSWRFWSGKELDFGSRRPGRLLVLLVMLVAIIFEWSNTTLLVLALGYLVSGVVARVAYSWQRRSIVSA